MTHVAHDYEARRGLEKCWAIKRECEGRPVRTLRAMPRTLRVLKDLFSALVRQSRG